MVSLIERDLGIREDENGDHSIRGVYRHEETSSLGSCFGRSTKNGIDSKIFEKIEIKERMKRIQSFFRW